MRSLVGLCVLLLASTLDAAPARGLRPRDELQLVFLDGDGRGGMANGATGDASLDVGRTSARCGGRHGCARGVIRRRFRLRVDGAGVARFVRVRAFLQTGAPGQRIRLDGHVLSTAPTLIDAAVPVRVAVAHTLEIEVSTAEPEGMLAESITWLVEDIR